VTTEVEATEQDVSGDSVELIDNAGPVNPLEPVVNEEPIDPGEPIDPLEFVQSKDKVKE